MDGEGTLERKEKCGRVGMHNFCFALSADLCGYRTMFKKPIEEEAPKKLASYTAKLDDAQMEKLRAICIARNFMPFEVG